MVDTLTVTLPWGTSREIELPLPGPNSIQIWGYHLSKEKLDELVAAGNVCYLGGFQDHQCCRLGEAIGAIKGGTDG